MWETAADPRRRTHMLGPRRRRSAGPSCAAQRDDCRCTSGVCRTEEIWTEKREHTHTHGTSAYTRLGGGNVGREGAGKVETEICYGNQEKGRKWPYKEKRKGSERIGKHCSTVTDDAFFKQLHR